jgi:hypothetical protein
VWEDLPKEFQFRNELRRKGAAGYLEDAKKSYYSYMYGLRKKTVDEPAIQKMVELYKQLPFEQRPYAKQYIRELAGYGRNSPLDEAAGVIANLNYQRTLGLNLRSALGNLTQQSNTWIDAGPLWSLKGYLRTFTKEGQELYKATGLPVEVPQAFTQDISPSAGWLEKLARVTGVFFSFAENQNRRHAFLTYLSRAETKGLSQVQATKEAIEGVHKTQFLYGKTNMPMALRTAPGRIFGQYTSFPIKQMEFYRKLGRENPLKLVVGLGLQTYGAKTVADVLGFDLSSFLGFGMTVGEGLDVLRSASDMELEEAVSLARGYMSQGSGVLPTGPAPTISAMLNIGEGIGKGEGVFRTVAQELTPVAWARTEDAIRNIFDKVESGEATISSRKGPAFMREKQEELYSTGIVKTALEAVGPKMSERTEKMRGWRQEQLGDVLESKRKRIIADAILNGDQGKAEKLMAKYGVAPTREMLQEALIRRSLPRDQRKKYQVAKMNQIRREEQRLSRLNEE